MKRKSLFLIFLISFSYQMVLGQIYKLKLSYTKLKEVAAIVGTTNSVAFYANKGQRKLSYAIYNPNTNIVIYFDGKKVTDEEFRAIKQTMVLDQNVKFSDDLIGATGVLRNANFILLKPLNILKSKKQLNSNFNRGEFTSVFSVGKKEFSPFYHTIMYKIIKNSNGTTLGGGSGPGETVVSKLP